MIKINIFFEYVFPLLLIPIIGGYYFETETIKQIISNDNKISLLVNIYSVLIGFIITTMAIFSTMSSQSLINISKNKKALELVICFFLTLLSMILVLIVCIVPVKILVFKWIIIFSFSMFFRYTFITLNIFYNTLNNLASIEKENTEYKRWFKDEIECIRKILNSK